MDNSSETSLKMIFPVSSLKNETDQKRNDACLSTHDGIVMERLKEKNSINRIELGGYSPVYPVMSDTEQRVKCRPFLLT